MHQFKTKTDQKKNIDSQKKNTVQAKANRTGLPNTLKYGVERLSGYSMDRVRVHYNSDKPAQVQALAYTQGTDIHVAPGQEKYLPHETWHVVQQMQGRVAPTMQHGNIRINDSPVLEREADIMGARAVRESSLDAPAQLKQAGGSFCVQKRAGDLACQAIISYDDNSSASARGENDAGTAARVVGVFAAYGMTNLAGIQPVSNQPGACAEPHAVANALEKGAKQGKQGKKGKKGKKEKLISGIYVSPAKFTTHCRKWVADEVINKRVLSPAAINFGNAMIGYDPRPKEKDDAKKIRRSSPDISYPRCSTCQQWIDSEGFVKSQYIPGNT